MEQDTENEFKPAIGNEKKMGWSKAIKTEKIIKKLQENQSLKGGRKDGIDRKGKQHS